MPAPTTEIISRHRGGEVDRRASRMRHLWIGLIGIAGALDALLSLRLVFRLFGANTDVAFVRVLYTATEPLLLPFADAFTDFSFAGLQFEPATAIALFVYGSILSGTAYFLRLALQLDTRVE